MHNTTGVRKKQARFLSLSPFCWLLNGSVYAAIHERAAAPIVEGALLTLAVGEFHALSRFNKS
jgi:hypothetical protein